MTLLAAILLCLLSSYLIWCSTNTFEPAANHLGRRLPIGVKGATLNAIGSSLPELLTASILLFLYNDKDGFAAGVGACAGSAVFNITLIPTFCIIAVGLKRRTPTTSEHKIRIHPTILIRDGLVLLVAELILILCLSSQSPDFEIGAGTAVVILMPYILYGLWMAMAVRRASRKSGGPVAPPDYIGSPSRYQPGQTGVLKLSEEEQRSLQEVSEASEASAPPPPKSTLKALLQLDFGRLLYRGRGFPSPERQEDGDSYNGQAWVVLLLSLMVMGAACHGLAESVVRTADILGIPTFVTAFILAAAATSVPDSILSIRDAQKGNYDDAFANAFGSNTFDISVCIGLPLLVYCLTYDTTIPIASSVLSVGTLRILLMLATVIVISILLMSLVRKTQHLSRWFGVSLSIVYLWFVATVLIETYYYEANIFPWLRGVENQVSAWADTLRSLL